MITIQEWNKFNNLDKTIWLEINHPAGCIGSPRKLVRGVGVNDASYYTSPRLIGGKVICPAYSSWICMLKRAYSESFSKSHPTYCGVSVCREWLSFTSFRKWWLINNIDGFDLDKDILSDSREYSPSSCIFIPNWLNKFNTDRRNHRGEYPIGVTRHNQCSRFVARCKNALTGKDDHLGLFTTPEAAHLAWRTRKLELALELKPKMDEIDLRIYPRVVEIINSAK